MRTVLVGAVIGACVGALYALAYLGYRDKLGGTFARLDATADLPDEPSARDRQRLYRQRTEAARAYREQNPGTSWPEAMRQARLAAQNGAAEVREDVPT